MAAERVQRRLKAILAADIVGYSRLMGADEEGTLARLKTHRRVLLEPKVEAYEGRIVKTSGDGLLAEFASAVDALRCAVEIQCGMFERNADLPEGKRVEFRIGINVGDIIVDGGDIFGDGVNVAARLESLADPGGICISGRVQEDTRSAVDVVFDDMGDQQLKNIARPVRAYRVRFGSDVARSRPALALPDKPSIAVLPFDNMSGDPRQDYFADGIVEEIITALSRMHWLFVIARNSSFTYKGRVVDVKQIGRELGVRYVLEGSVRKAGDRLRITGQLIDTSSSAHLWADRFDGHLEDIFDLQDRITASVVAAIAPKLELAEIMRAMRKPTENLDAYDYFLRGMASHHKWAGAGNQEALSLFLRAIEIDPTFAAAYGMAARCYVQRKAIGLLLQESEIAEAERLARKAAEMGKDDAGALWTGGFALAYVVGDVETGDAFIDAALDLNPNLTLAWAVSGWVKAWLGQPEVAIKRAARAMRLSPHDTLIFSMQAATALGHFLANRHAEALHWAEMAVRERPNFVNGIGMIAASAALLGDKTRADQAVSRLRAVDPLLRLSSLEDHNPFQRKVDLDHWIGGLRKAGLSN